MSRAKPLDPAHPATGAEGVPEAHASSTLPETGPLTGPLDSRFFKLVESIPGIVYIETDGRRCSDRDRGRRSRGTPELRESLFRPFERGPSANPHSPGMGVGLSLVARFAEQLGGRAWVEDRVGGGASFRVWLPSGPLS
jgi:hypothetical protein